MSMKDPLTPAGIEPAAFRFVAQHLSHCATAVPFIYIYIYIYIFETCVSEVYKTPIQKPNQPFSKFFFYNHQNRKSHWPKLNNNSVYSASLSVHHVPLIVRGDHEISGLS